MSAAPALQPRPIRVASLPHDHVYVRHLTDPDRPDGVERLPEPFRGGPPGASWYPSPMLDPAWIARTAPAFDVFHVHFGFDHLPAERLRECVTALRRARRPLVFTVHDLTNPHHDDPGPHRAALDVLVPAAAALITLTPGAAEEIRRRWGRRAIVAPHPHIVPLERMGAPRPRRDGFTVGVHLKNVRANMLTLPVVRAAKEAVEGIGAGARLRVDLHERVATAGDPLAAPALVAELRRLASHGAVDLSIHPFFDDDELWDYLAGLDASVLPYRFGTHSGWLEACHDLGTHVVAPTCGFYREQRDVVPFDPAPERLGSSLGAAIREAHRRGPATPAKPSARRAERAALAAQHRRVYEEVLGWAD